MTKNIEQSTPLPSMHINHSAAFSNEIMARIAGFDGALLTLETDMEGMKHAYQDARAKLDSEHKFAMEERSALKTDIERARRMAIAAQDAFEADATANDNPSGSVDAERLSGSLDNSDLSPQEPISDHT